MTASPGADAAGFSIGSERRPDGVYIVRVTGEADLSHEQELRGALQQAAEESEGTVVVDLTECEFIDSTAVRALLVSREAQDGAGGEVLVPLRSLQAVRGLRGEAAHPGHEGQVGARLDLRHVLRGVARDRSGCLVTLTDGRTVSGTIDRVGVDFVDLAEQEASPSFPLDSLGYAMAGEHGTTVFTSAFTNYTWNIAPAHVQTVACDLVGRNLKRDFLDLHSSDGIRFKSFHSGMFESHSRAERGGARAAGSWLAA